MPPILTYLQKIQAGIEYIEANLDQDIDPSQVAIQGGLSQWHFQRVFKALTNETLKTYIRSRRLANALNQLASTSSRILDIALDAGYESQESFTRAFKHAFSMSPLQYRKLGENSLFLHKVEFNEAYLKHINQNISLSPEIKQYNKLLLVGLETSFYGVDSEKNNIGEKLPPLWARFLSRREEIENPISGPNYGVVIQPLSNTDTRRNDEDMNKDPEKLRYLAAIAVSGDTTPPVKMTRFEIAPATYAEFRHKGDPVHINDTVNYIYSTWLSSSGFRHTGGPDLEIYGSGYIEGSESSLMHYAIPVTSR